LPVVLTTILSFVLPPCHTNDPVPITCAIRYVESPAHKVEPFPLDWCTEEEFDELRWNDDEVKRSKITDEHIEIVEQWEMENHYAQDFGSAWVQPVELDLQSWRERQLKGLI
jgi:hypothetical protein